MKGGMEQLKRLMVYAVLIWRRMWKTPGYFFVFLLVPIVLLSVSRISKGESQVKVAVCIEGLKESGNASEEEDSKNFHRELKTRLEAKEGAIRFSFYESEEEVKREVAIAKAECGFVISEDLFENLQKKRFKNSISYFVSPQTSMQTVCKEAFFAELFSLFEEYTFPEQAEEMILEELKENGETGNEKKEAVEKEEEMEGEIEAVAKRAEELLEQYRFNGSTFQFEQEDYKSEVVQGKESLEKETSEEKISKSDMEENSSLFSIRGVCSLLVFICALCGTMDALEDENAKRICRLKHKNGFTSLTIFMPAFVMSVISLLCYMIAGIMDELWKEIGAMLIYLLLLVVYCMILKKLCKKEENLASVMSILILLTAVVCPVFVDLAQFIPVLKVLRQGFPVYHYLAML